MATQTSIPVAPESAAAANSGVRGWHRWQGWRSTPWWGGLFIAAIAALAAFDIWRGYVATVSDTGRELDALSRVIAEQTARSVQTVDHVTRHIADAYRSGRLDALADEAALHAYLRDQAVGLVQVTGLSIIDADGRVRASSSAYPLAADRPSVAEVPAFQQLKARRDPGMVVARAMRGVSRPDTWIFPLGRRLEKADGRFAGAIAAGGRVEYFQNFYRDVRLERDTMITLAHRDGTLLARHPAADPSLMGRRFELLDGNVAAAGEATGGLQARARVDPASPGASSASTASRGGSGAALRWGPADRPARYRSPVDGVERFGVLRLVADYPLAVVVSRDVSLVLAPWRAEAAGTALRTLALGVLAMVLLVLVRRQFHRLESARASLEESRERFALAAAGSDEGIWDWDVAGDRMYASARTREIFGLVPGPDVQPRDEWFASLRVHPDDVAGRFEALHAHLEGRTPVYSDEYRVRRIDGEYGWVRLRGLCVRDAQGQPLRMAGSVTDIDARRRAEDALRLSEERLALAMIGSTGGHWVWEPPSDALFVSATLNQVFGLPTQLQVTTKDQFFAHVRLHPDDEPRIEQMRRDVDDPAVARLDYEYRIVLPGSDEVRWILTRAQCFRDGTGRAQRVAGVSVDITARKRTEESLRLSEERFALAVAGSSDGILDWDLVNDRMYTSERMLQMLGLPSEVTVRTRAGWLELLRIHPDDRERHARELQQFLAGRETLREGEYRFCRPDGSCFWARLRNLCLRDADGRALRLSGSVSDIDAYKRVEAALRESEERYALAMTGSNEGHWVWELGAHQVFVSAKLAEMMAITGGAQVMPDALYLERLPIHPDDIERVRRNRERHLAGETPRLDHEFRIVRPDTGEVRWLHTRAQCFRDGQGHALRMAGATVDATQRKAAEEALRASEERFTLAVAGSDDGVWDWDFSAGMAFESARARELQALPPGPELQPLAEIFGSLRVHPQDAPRRAEGIRAHLAGESPAYECEYRVRHDDGLEESSGHSQDSSTPSGGPTRSGGSGGPQYRWIRVRALCVRDAEGRPVRMAGSVSDIDARKRAEQGLRESEERFARALAGSNDGIIDWDIALDRLFASPRAWRLIGLPPEDGVLTRAQWAPLVMPRFHPDDAVRVLDELNGNGLKPAEAHEGEYLILGADGDYHWMRFRGRLTRDAAGRPLRWAGSVSDIDALKKTEQALRRSQERYQLAADGSNEGLWDWDLDSDSLFLSPRAQDLVGLPCGEVQRPRRDWLRLAQPHPDDRAAVREALTAHLRGQSRRFKVEFRLQQPEGEWRWYRQRGVAVRDADGRPLRMAGSLEDITDRKRDEAERERLEAQLRQAQKLEAIGTLAGGIAHDFNNILAAILGYGEMAQKGAAQGSALRRHIDAALSAGLRAKSLVERILAFSRAGMGERVPVHVQSVVAEALDAVVASLPAGIRLERRLEAGDAAVLGDPTQVHQVVMNLCANAVQAMKASGTLSVTLDQAQHLESPCCATRTLCDGSYVRLRVADTGSGIPEHLLERIFDPFFTTKEVGVGTGLGLSLVHGIVTDLGGGIDVDSTIGEGAAFTVYLPWQAGVAPLQSAEEDLPCGNGQTVLLVDDEEPLVRLGEEMLAGLGYEPIGFTSSVAALQRFRDTPARFDLVLSDEAMPEMTGSELARAIRAIRGDIPIVLMSGYVTPALTQKARDAGVADVLAKPLVAHDIARSLAEALQALQDQT